MFGNMIFMDVEVQSGFVGRGEETDKVGVAVVFEQIYLAGFIDCEDAGPDED
jgi:hypothetical protein